MSVGGVGATGPSAVGLITNVLREHRLVITGYRSQPMCCTCQEGCSGRNGHMLTMEPDEHPEHVAAEVDAALGGLTREVGAGFRGSQNITPVAKGLTASDFGPHWIVGERWVSGWTPEEP